MTKAELTQAALEAEAMLLLRRTLGYQNKNYLAIRRAFMERDILRRAIEDSKLRLARADQWLKDRKVTEDSIIGDAAKAYRILEKTTQGGHHGRSSEKETGGDGEASS
jgi:hypothetical protein